MQLLAYGEDALTLYALVARLRDVLRALGDDSDPAAATVVFRPSFGRRGVGAEMATACPSAQFGEFDAIVGTSRATYLIESKWHRSSELRDGVVDLRPEQRYRHRVMRWYLTRWRQYRPADWPAFVAAAAADAAAQFPQTPVAPIHSTLAANLEFLLRRLETAGEPIRDVVLFMCESGLTPPRAAPADFELVCIDYPNTGGRGFVELCI